MSENVRLSHSSATMFADCSMKWKYWYKDKLRPKTQSAALLFGTAVDRGVGAILQPDEKQTAESIFGYFWRFQEVNGKKTYLPTCKDIVYSNTDYDAELLHQEDIDKLKEEYKIEDPIMEIYQLYQYKDKVGFDHLPDEQKVLLNHANWLSLYRKGLLMLDAVKTEIMPNVEEVLGVQEFVKLENQDGDSVIGYVDFVCRWKGYNKPVVFDFKTSSIEYNKDSVVISPQLSLYVNALHEKYDTRYAGYLVLNKNVRKNKTKVCKVCSFKNEGTNHKTCNNMVDGQRCNSEWDIKIDPKIWVQIIVDEINEVVENNVIDNMDWINKSIKSGLFHRNMSSCIKYNGKVKCAFYDKCYKGTDEGLQKPEDKINESQ